MTSVLDHTSFGASGGRRLRAASAAGLALVTATGLLLAQAGTAQAAATAVGLGTADSFAVLAGAGITNTGTTVITGDIGSAPTPSITAGISVTGAQNPAGTAGAKLDLVTAYDTAAGQPFVATPAGPALGGSQFTSGVYNHGTLDITGTVTLNAQGNANAIFVFQTASSLITASTSRVELINGAQACNVFWQVGTSATLGSDSVFVGNILALADITLDARASVEGRILARNGEVTMIDNTVTKPGCTTSSGGGAGGGTGGTGGDDANGSGSNASGAANSRQVPRVPRGSVDTGDGSSIRFLVTEG